MQRIWWGAALTGSLLAAQASSAAAQVSPEQMQRDLEVMAETLRTRHPGVFHFTPRDRFEQSIAELHAGLERMNPDEALVAFDRIATSVGDAHTYVEIPQDGPRLPLVIRRFGEEFRIAAALPGYERAIGTRLTAIGSTPIGQAHQRAMETITPRNENASLRETLATIFLNLGAVLHGLGLVPSNERAMLTFRADDGTEFQLEATTGRFPPGAGWIPVSRTQPLSRSRPQESFWCTWLEQARTVYCNFRRYDNLQANARQLFDLIERQRPAKVVIDLRENGGGDYFVGRRHVLDPLRALADINRRGHLFVLIGPQTFSAAMANAAQFRAETNAILVGRPIGEKPNSYSEVDERVLPNSRWRLHYSTRHYEFQPGGENVVRPHVEIVPTWEEFRAGRDATLEWVLAQPIESAASN